MLNAALVPERGWWETGLSADSLRSLSSFLILWLPGLTLRHRALNHKPREEQIWPKAASAFISSTLFEAEPK